MTKFLLCGGGDFVPDKKNVFIAEIKSSLSAHSISASALIIPFARYESDWQTVYDKYVQKYSDIEQIKTFIQASPVSDVFVEQIAVADIIFVAGGSEITLLPFLKETSKDLFDGKVVVGTSAGANIFSKYYYSNDRDEVAEGLGFLNVKTICHYTQEQMVRRNTLSSFRENLPVYTIPEGDYIILRDN